MAAYRCSSKAITLRLVKLVRITWATIRIIRSTVAHPATATKQLRSHIVCKFRNLTRTKSSDMSRKKRKIKTATTVERLRCKLTSCLHQYLHALRGKGHHRRSA